MANNFPSGSEKFKVNTQENKNICMVHYVSNSYYLVIKKPENKTSLFLPWQEPKLIFSHFCQV